MPLAILFFTFIIKCASSTIPWSGQVLISSTCIIKFVPLSPSGRISLALNSIAVREILLRIKRYEHILYIITYHCPGNVHVEITDCVQEDCIKERTCFLKLKWRRLHQISWNRGSRLINNMGDTGPQLKRRHLLGTCSCRTMFWKRLWGPWDRLLFIVIVIVQHENHSFQPSWFELGV